MARGQSRLFRPSSTVTIALLTLAALTLTSTAVSWWITFQLLKYVRETELRHSEDRRQLLNRMQVGVTQYPAPADAPAYEPGAIDLDDDELMSARLMSKEQLADAFDHLDSQSILAVPPMTAPPTMNGM